MNENKESMSRKESRKIMAESKLKPKSKLQKMIDKRFTIRQMRREQFRKTGSYLIPPRLIKKGMFVI